MFKRTDPATDPRLSRIREEIARDRQRLNQTLAWSPFEEPAMDAPPDAMGKTGRLYRIFTLMGEV